MKTITNIEQLRKDLKKIRKEGTLKGTGNRIGFVPTMGCLHDGHLSLLRRARKETDFVVLSIFVNPVQFGPGEDYCDYPRDLSRDKRLAESAGVDIVFAPSVCEIYPAGYSTYVDVEGLSSILCGASRAGHFRGCVTIVTKLFNIVRPDIAYFGRKDFQQAVIIRKMVKDLNIGIKIKVLPIVRERDGLAMSSRNTCLNRRERNDALILHRALQQAQKMVRSNIRNPKIIKSKLKELINGKESAKVDYIAVVNPKNLNEVKEITQTTVVLLAVCIGRTRLIDNIVIV